MLKNTIIALLSAGCICLAELQKELVTPVLYFAMAFVIFSIITFAEMQIKNFIYVIKYWIEFRRTVSRKITLNAPTKAS